MPQKVPFTKFAANNGVLDIPGHEKSTLHLCIGAFNTTLPIVLLGAEWLNQPILLKRLVL